MNSNKDGSVSGDVRSTKAQWVQKRGAFSRVLVLACSLIAGLLETRAAPPMVRIASTRPVVLSWPTNFPGFGLETRTNLSPGGAWESCSLKPVVVGTNYFVTNTLTESTRWFRLSDLPLRYCRSHLQQIGIAMRVWAMNNGDLFPFHVSTTQGGTLELRALGPDGFDANSYLHFMALSNELAAVSSLVCPSDPARQAAASFSTLQPQNVSYRLRTGPNVNETLPEEVLAVCPIDGNTLYCDGLVPYKTEY